MKKDLVCIYPCSNEFTDLLKHACLIDEKYKVCALVSPKGWGLSDLLVDLGEHNEKVLLTVKNTFSDVDCEFNTVFVPEFSVSEKFSNEVINNVTNILSKIEKIIWRASISETQKERLIVSCAEMGCEIDFKPPQQWSNNDLMTDDSNELIEFSTPIVAISSSWDNMDKFKISLALRESLLSRGYHVSQIGARDYCEIFGFHSFPMFIFNQRINESDKVILFNRFIKRIVETENPDVIVITIPGAANNYDAKFTNGFGILHYLTFKAITVDFHIYSIFYMHPNNDYLKLMSESCKYRFDSAVDCYHMSSTFLNLTSSYEKNTAVFSTVTRQMVDDVIESIKETSIIPIMNLYKVESVEDTVDLILHKLSRDSVHIMV